MYIHDRARISALLKSNISLEFIVKFPLSFVKEWLRIHVIIIDNPSGLFCCEMFLTMCSLASLIMTLFVAISPVLYRAWVLLIHLTQLFFGQF